MGFTNFYLTNKGANLLAKSQVGVVISFTKVGIGKGDLPVGVQPPSVTALYDKVKDLPIAGISAGNGQAQIQFQFVNTGIATSFLWKELGIYATDPDEGEILYAYGHAGANADLIPPQAQSSIEFLFNMIVKISNTTQVTAVIDNNLIFALKGDISYIGNTEPSNKPAGLWWYNPDNDDLKFRTNTGWILGGGAKVINSITEPTSNLKDGLFWYNPTKDEIRMYITGIGFKPLGSVTIMQFESTYTAPNDGIDTVPINIVGYTYGQILLVDQDGVTLAKDTNYTFNQNVTSIVLNGFTLKQGESIHFTNLRAIATEDIQAAADLFQSHVDNKANPHQVTAEQVKMPDGTTSVSSAIGQLSNPAININPDFKIWQRYIASDATTFTNPANRYIADRYRFNGTGTVKPVAGGAEITGTINIKYVLEDADFQKLNGKTLTRSWSESNVVQKETFVCNSATIFDKTITNKIVNFIKIELGEIATPLSPRPYGEEKFLCQRYCVSGELVGTSYIIEASNIWFFIPFNQKLRINPTLSNLGNLSVKANNGIIQTGFTFSNIWTAENGIHLLATKIGHGLTISNTPHLYSSTAIFDAEIY